MDGDLKLPRLQVTPGALTDEIRSWVDREYALGAPAAATRNNRPRPAAPPPRSRRQLRRKQYRRVQRLYAKNRSAAADECLSGEWQEPREPASLDTLEPFWRDLFERQSVRDIRRPVLPLPELGLVRRIDLPELARVLKRMRPSAPGPDGMKLADLRRIPVAELCTHFNLWLALGYQPASCRWQGARPSQPDEEELVVLRGAAPRPHRSREGGRSVTFAMSCFAHANVNYYSVSV